MTDQDKAKEALQALEKVPYGSYAAGWRDIFRVNETIRTALTRMAESPVEEVSGLDLYKMWVTDGADFINVLGKRFPHGLIIKKDT